MVYMCVSSAAVNVLRVRKATAVLALRPRQEASAGASTDTVNASRIGGRACLILVLNCGTDRTHKWVTGTQHRYLPAAPTTQQTQHHTLDTHTQGSILFIYI